MTLTNEQFEYSGDATLSGGNPRISLHGKIKLAGRLGRKLIATSDGKHVPGLLDLADLKGTFVPDESPPAGFFPLGPVQVKNAHTIKLAENSGYGMSLPCTIETSEESRVIRIIHAGYRHVD